MEIVARVFSLRADIFSVFIFYNGFNGGNYNDSKAARTALSAYDKVSDLSAFACGINFIGN